MKNKRGILLLAVTFAVAAPAFADNVPGHSKGGSNYVTFSEGFAAEQNSHGNSAQCNFLSGSSKEHQLSTGSVAGESVSGIAAGENFVRAFDFGGNEGDSSDKDKGKGKGKHEGESGDGNGSGVGSGVLAPLVSVPEPGLQSLVLFGLAGLGIVSYRRKSLPSAL